MAHQQQIEFLDKLRKMFPDAFAAGRILEIGSLDINGSVRSFFDGCDYLGIDVAAGPGVDLVCQGQDYDGADASFDTVVSCEVMEHNPWWRETFLNMLRVCKPGGLVIMTCASTGRPEHGTSRTTPDSSPLTVALGWEYYRNLTAGDFAEAVELDALLHPFAFFGNRESCDLYFAGFRRGAPPPADAERKLRVLKAHYRRRCRRAIFSQAKARLLIAAVGEERYRAGPVRPWRSGASRAPLPPS
jgi:SAM-dependent methyltransferase